MTQDEEWLLKEKYNGKKSEGFFADSARLKNGEPLSYIIGSIPFLNTTIFLDSHPLIPRPETEFWVEEAITEMGTHSPLRILDLCAGSGCIGVAVLKAIPEAHVDFVEIDASHHDTIRKNILTHAIDPNRTNVYGGSLFECVTGTYDFILTNPPYIDKTLNRVEVGVATHEPALALYGGSQGVAIITEIIRNVSPFLSPSGILYIEHEPEQCTHIQNLSSQLGYRAHTFPDQFGISRYTRITRA